MIATDRRVIGRNADGGDLVEVTLKTDVTPETLPTTGEGIQGCKDTDTFGGFSILFALDTNTFYVINEDGEFVEPGV